MYMRVYIIGGTALDVSGVNLIQRTQNSQRMGAWHPRPVGIAGEKGRRRRRGPPREALSPVQEIPGGCAWWPISRVVLLGYVLDSQVTLCS